MCGSIVMEPDDCWNDTGCEHVTMIDISDKQETHRTAVAEGRIILDHGTVAAIRNGEIRKGDPIRVAEVAVLLAVKRTPSLLPHCHPIPIGSIDVGFHLGDDSVTCRCTVRARYRTGVEMEALLGVSTGLLTIWDMVKYLEKDGGGQYPGTLITDIRILEKIK